MIQAVIDVNVLVSGILGPHGFSRQIVLAWAAGHFSVITSEVIISELHEKLNLPRIIRHYSLNTSDDIQWIIGLLRTQAQLIPVPIEEVYNVTGDPEDDGVLATGRLSKSDYLVTGDKRLLDLTEYEGMKIITPRAFVELLQADTSSQP